MTSSWCHHFMSKWHCQMTSFCHQNDFDLPSYWCQNDARMRFKIVSSIKQWHQNDVYILHHFDFEIMTSSWCHLFMSIVKHHFAIKMTSTCPHIDVRMTLEWDQTEIKIVSKKYQTMTSKWRLHSTSFWLWNNDIILMSPVYV